MIVCGKGCRQNTGMVGRKVVDLRAIGTRVREQTLGGGGERRRDLTVQRTAGVRRARARGYGEGV